MQTPEHKELQSHVVGLGYYDASSGKSVLIAQTKDSQGQLLNNNQVIYTNAFTGLKADVVYTYARASFEQDIVLRTQPPSPQQFGFNAATTKLEVFTEFVNPPQPVKTDMALSDGTVDETLDFGIIKWARGGHSRSTTKMTRRLYPKLGK